MSYIITYVRVALATSDFIQIILQIPATYEIHRKYQNRVFAWTKPNNSTVNRLERKQLERPKEEYTYTSSWKNVSSIK